MSNLDSSSQRFLPQEGVNLSGDSPEHINDDGATVKSKRIACLICRKRKLRCDGIRPSCGSCSRLGHECGYNDIRRKSGPKRGYVKELEARLNLAEHQLRTKNIAGKKLAINKNKVDRFEGSFDLAVDLDNDLNTINQTSPDVINARPSSETQKDRTEWAILGLGLEEPLPPREMMEELDKIYFNVIHKSIPMIHKYRYLAALNLAPISRPPICLRYSMWTLVASITPEYSDYTDMFYRRARKYVELDEMKGHGESFVTVGHAQCWALIASFEFRMMYFPRAWMSVGRTSRLVQMLGLQRVDHDGLEVKRTLNPPRDWVDREERRRTFWMAYCNDRYASIGTGWPMTFDEKDISTDLPSSLDAFEKGEAEVSISFADALTEDGASKLSTLGAVIVVASIFGQNLTHLHRSHDDDEPDDPTNGGFWKRHRQLDKLLATITSFLPVHLKLPTVDQDPNIPFLNIALHTAVICLHQAAILKAEKHRLGDSLIKESGKRCFHAAEEIYNVTRMISFHKIGRLHPFVAFCLYVAARVLIQTYQKRRDAIDIRDKLEFLLKAMQVHMKKIPLTASFLVQLQLELEAAGLENPLAKVSVQNSDHLMDKAYSSSPVASYLSSQPTSHEIRAAQISTSFARDRSGTEPEKNTVFELPPRLSGKLFPTPQDSRPITSETATYAAYNIQQMRPQQQQQQSFTTTQPTLRSAYLNSSSTPNTYYPIQTRTTNLPSQQPVMITSSTSMNVEPYFSQQSSYRQPSSQPVDDWNSADLALAPALNDANWQYDAMAWDIAPQEIGIQGMQDVSTEPWRTDAGCMNVDGGGGGGGSSVDRQ